MRIVIGLAALLVALSSVGCGTDPVLPPLPSEDGGVTSPPDAGADAGVVEPPDVGADGGVTQPRPSGAYEGYAVIIGYMGSTTTGCWPTYGKLVVGLAFGPSGVDDGTGTAEVFSWNPDDFRFSSVALGLGGSTPEERQDRTYAMRFNADQSVLKGRITYTNNDAATRRTGCSGYVFDASYARR